MPGTAAKTVRTSQFAGVIHRDDKWEAEVTVNGRQKYLGRFESELEAAQAAANYHAEFDKADDNRASTYAIVENDATKLDIVREDREAKRDLGLEERVVNQVATTDGERKIREEAYAEEAAERLKLYRETLSTLLAACRGNAGIVEKNVIADNRSRETREQIRNRQREEREVGRTLTREAVRAAIEEERHHRQAAYDEERQARKAAELLARDKMREAKKKHANDVLKLTVNLPSDLNFNVLLDGKHEWDCPACGNTQPLASILDTYLKCHRCGAASTIKHVMTENRLGWSYVEEVDGVEQSAADKRQMSRQMPNKLETGRVNQVCKYCRRMATGLPIWVLGDGVIHTTCPVGAPTVVDHVVKKPAPLWQKVVLWSMLAILGLMVYAAIFGKLPWN